jgi:lipoate-protein ligase A
LEDPEKCLDLDFCKREGIVVRRRQNPGGAIWGPGGSAIIGIYMDTDLPWVPLKRVDDAFRITLTRLAEVMGRLFGIDAVYRPLNDVEVEGRKLVPTSARLEKGILTMRLLVNVVPTNPEILKLAMRTPPEKVQDKRIKDVGARFTCLQNEVGREIRAPELESVATETVKGVLGKDVALVPGELTELERRYGEEYQEKYASDAWLFANSERMRFRTIPPGALKREGRHKAPAGLIRVTLLILNHLMKDLIITGDFHPSPNDVLQDMEASLRGKPCDPAVVEEQIRKIFERPDVEIAGTRVEDFVAAFERAFDQGL